MKLSRSKCLSRYLHFILSLLPFLFGDYAWTAEPQVLFKLTFDGGTVEARIAKGSPKAKINVPKDAPRARPKFEKSLFGYGEALVIGQTGLTIEYDMKGNARNDRGSFSCWVKRAGTRPKEMGYRYDYFYWLGDGGYVCSLYRPNWYGAVTLMRLRNMSYAENQCRLLSNSDDGKWHMLTYTWSGKKVRGYFDGRLEAKEDDFELPAINRLVIGGGPLGTKRLIDEITFYDEALTEAEVKQLYRQGAGMDQNAKITIPPRRNKIAIDGKIEEKEWAGAVETTGFVDNSSGLFSEAQTHARLCYDDEALYIALSSEYPQKVKDDYAMTGGR